MILGRLQTSEPSGAATLARLVFCAPLTLKTMIDLCDIVPQEMDANLVFRRNLLKWCQESHENRQVVVSACTRSILFFTDAFMWIQDVKRHPDAPNRPFIAWPFQRQVMIDMDAAIGRKSQGIVKSRDVGGSTMPLIVFLRKLLFFRDQTLMVMSRNEKLVIDRHNPDSLFYKLDHMLKWLPSWMTSCIDGSKDSRVNTVLNSNIIGCSTTSDAGRGGRKQAILVDEYSAFDRRESHELIGSVQHNTKCVFYNGTPKGIGNGFHKIITGGNIQIHRLHWSKHPVHGLGLYQSVDGKLELLDKEFWDTACPADILRPYPELEKNFPPSDGLAKLTYPFIRDNKVRSPYYDYECLRCPIPKLIAQELDMDFIGSGSPFFNLDDIRDYTRLFSRPPVRHGELTWDEDFDTIKWAGQDSGRMQLWFTPDLRGRPPTDRKYVIGCDISSGTGATNSHISIGDCRDRSKVASFTSPHVRPERLAEYAHAIATWFGDARIWFEGSGPGSDFGARLKEIGCPNVYYMTKTSGKKAEKPGWFPNGDMKQNLLTEYGSALNMRELTNPDEAAVNECLLFEFSETGKVVHVEEQDTSDPSGAKKNHADRVMADAGMWSLMKKVIRPKSEELIGQNTAAAVQRDVDRIYRNRNFWSPTTAPKAWCSVRR